MFKINLKSVKKYDFNSMLAMKRYCEATKNVFFLQKKK